MAVVASDNDSVGDSSTQCNDDIDDDNEEEETDVEESGAGGWIMNPPVSTIVQQHRAFDTTNGYIAVPNPDSSNFSDVRVKDSRNVHLGSEVNYNGSVTIHVKHVVYTSSPTQDASKSDTSVSDNTSNLSTNKDNGDINRCIFQQNIKLNKVTPWFWTWKRAVLSCVITLILLAVVMSITVHFTHKSVSSEISNSSLEDPDKVSPLSDYYKVVCYFTNWAWYRRGIGRYLPEYIDHTLCTHIVYGFAVLDNSKLVIKTNDSWADYEHHFYEKVVAYKERGLKVLLALGGWDDSAGDKYSRMVNSPSARKNFIDHAVQFIANNSFDGLDLFWEYPVCWQGICNKGPDSDKESFAAILRELSAVFKPKGLLLSAAVSPDMLEIDKGYDVPALAKYLDWITVIASEYHGDWNKRTGHVAPLYYHPDEMYYDEMYYLNANYSINYWISKGAPPRSIVMATPLYGRSFSLADRNVHGLNAPTNGGGKAGEATKERGFLSYYEICERTLKKGWTVVQDKDRRIGPYAYRDDQWVSFDDAQQIKLKAELIKKLGLGGGSVWALDLDDFNNRCGCEPSPLLRTMNRVLRNYPKGPLCPITEGAVVIDGSQTDTADNNGTDTSFRIVERDEWGAQPASRPLIKMKLPVSYVIIGRSQGTPSHYCTTQSECTTKVRAIQAYYLENNFDDIGYSFFVGGDGLAYVGRNWDYVGRHACWYYNDKSIGISFIGNFGSFVPSKLQIRAAQKIIELGVKDGKITPDYKLLDQQFWDAGDNLYNEIIKWPHYSCEDGPDSSCKSKCPTVHFTHHPSRRISHTARTDHTGPIENSRLIDRG